MLVQTLLILFLSSWMYQEYLNNIYLQAYVNQVVQADGLLIAILVITTGLGLSLGISKIRKRTHKEIGAFVSEPQVSSPQAPSLGPAGSSAKPATDLHAMVAALKAEMAHHASMEPLAPIEVKETPTMPVQAPPGPPPTRTLAVVPTTVPSTVITGMPVLKRTSSEQDKKQNSQQ